MLGPIDQFFFRLTELRLELSRLLGVSRDTFESSSLGRNMARCLEHHIGNVERERDAGYLLLLRLVRDLQFIEKADRALFRYYRRKLREDDLGNFFGTRFEIRIAAGLIDRRLSFKGAGKGPSIPDFEVRLGARTVCIECKSCVIAAEGGVSLSEAQAKVLSAIEDKATKPYFNQSLWLFVDVTNLFSRRADFGIQDFLDQRGKLMAEFSARGGGGLGIFWTFWKREPDGTLGVGSNVALSPCLEAPLFVQSFGPIYLGNRGPFSEGGWVPSRT